MKIIKFDEKNGLCYAKEYESRELSDIGYNDIEII
jgi:hypothetical protein